jgi:hypothetical protein
MLTPASLKEQNQRARFAKFKGIPTPFELMKFRFTYDGRLRASGTNNGTHPEDQWLIRRQVRPQLAELWRTHPALKGLGLSVHIGIGMGVHFGGPQPIKIQPSGTVQSVISKPIELDGYKFIPLVRKSLELTCDLKITFLRRDDPGALILPGGDLDNRMKTFLDGLKVPSHLKGNKLPEGSPPDDFDKFFCLTEEDSLITGIAIETDRLLTPEGDKNDVRLVVETTIRVMRITQDNVGFLGD